MAVAVCANLPSNGTTAQKPTSASLSTPSTLTAIRDPDEAWERHIEDSLAVLPVIEQYACSSSGSSGGGGSSRLSLIDVGTGAGLPGMVLAIVRPDWQVGVVWVPPDTIVAHSAANLGCC